MTYVRVDDAIKAICVKRKGALMSKADISDAFKIMPIRSSQWPYFCVKWDGMYYVFVRLVFGCRSSPRVFDTLSQAVCWIACNKYGVQTMFHMLDDFLTVGKPVMCTGERTRAILSLIFKRLRIPLAPHKCIGPTTCLEYLGIILDSEEMVAKLPNDKVMRIIQFIEHMLNKSKCTKHELLQLFGHLNFASRVILPGRSFVSYLISLSSLVKNLRDMVYLDFIVERTFRCGTSFLITGMVISLL